MKKISLIIALVITTSLFLGSCKNKTNTTTQIDSIPETNVVDNQKTETPVENNEGKVISLTDESFKELVFDYSTNKDWKYQGKLPCIVDFYADWCGPCKMVAPIMEELAKTYQGKVLFYKVNVDNNPEVSKSFSIQSIPAVLFVPKNDKPQMSVGAMNKESYVKAINETLLVK